MGQTAEGTEGTEETSPPPWVTAVSHWPRPGLAGVDSTPSLCWTQLLDVLLSSGAADHMPSFCKLSAQERLWVQRPGLTCGAGTRLLTGTEVASGLQKWGQGPAGPPTQLVQAE